MAPCRAYDECHWIPPKVEQYSNLITGATNWVLCLVSSFLYRPLLLSNPLQPPRLLWVICSSSSQVSFSQSNSFSFLNHLFKSRALIVLEHNIWLENSSIVHRAQYTSSLICWSWAITIGSLGDVFTFMRYLSLIGEDITSTRLEESSSLN